MVKELCHPKAFLSLIKNTRLGLKARTKILSVMERSAMDAQCVAREAGVPYGVALHHLRLLHAEGIVHRRGRRPYIWALSGLGQRRLTEST